ncbi:hypothetical protein ACOSQ2_004746 [Xanthoceras sorbifolium]
MSPLLLPLFTAARLLFFFLSSPPYLCSSPPFRRSSVAVQGSKHKLQKLQLNFPSLLSSQKKETSRSTFFYLRVCFLCPKFSLHFLLLFLLPLYSTLFPHYINKSFFSFLHISFVHLSPGFLCNHASWDLRLVLEVWRMPFGARPRDSEAKEAPVQHPTGIELVISPPTYNVQYPPMGDVSISVNAFNAVSMIPLVFTLVLPRSPLMKVAASNDLPIRRARTASVKMRLLQEVKNTFFLFMPRDSPTGPTI